MLTIVPDQADLKNVDIVEPRTSIGAHESNSLVVHSGEVSDFHAEFHLQNDEVALIDLGSESGTTLNGKIIDGRVKVKHGDVVKVGDTEFKLIDMDINAEEKEKVSNSTNIRDAVSGWVLIGKPDSLLPGEFPIEGTMLVGRDEECDFSIPYNHISRQHAQFDVTDDVLKVKDLGSTNGTLVNGEKISETELRSGDVICFDKKEFLILKHGGEDAEADDKTMARESVTVIKKNTEEKTTDESTESDDYKAISEGATNIGKAWQESDANVAKSAADNIVENKETENKTVIMASVDSESNKTRAMPMVEQQSLATLEYRTKPLLGEKIDLLKKNNTVGRTNDNDIEINEASVSSKHANINYEHGSWVIQDLDSYNGTFVNNKKCKSKKLKNGDVINLGRVQLLFSNEDDSDVSSRIKRLPSGIKVPILLVKTILFLVVVSVISEFTYNYITKLDFGSEVELKPDWENISSDRINPARPVLYDMNSDGKDDVIIADERGITEVIDGGNGFKLSSFASGISLYSSPLLVDVGADNKMDIVNVSSNGEVVAFDVNGGRLWSNTDMQGQMLIAQAVAVKVNNDNVKDIILPTEKDGIVVIDGVTGQQFVQLPEINGKVISRPVVQDINRDGVTDIISVTDTNHVIAFSIKDSNVRKLWEVTTPPVLVAPLRYGEIRNHGVIFVATQNDGILALNSYTGNKIWQTRIDDLLLSERVVIDSDGDKINDTVIQATFSGNIIALDSVNGDQIWNLALPDKIQTEPVVIPDNTVQSNQLIVADTQGSIHLIDIESGELVSSIKINKADLFVVSPVLINGTFILLSNNGNLFSYVLDRQ